MKLTKRVMYVADAVSVVKLLRLYLRKEKKKGIDNFIEWSFHFPPKYQHTFVVMQSRSKQARNIVD